MSPLALPFPDIDPVALQLGPVAIKWYGLAYAAGLLLGWLYVKRLVSNDRLWSGGKAPFAPAVVDDLFIWVALGVVVGGRLGNVLLYDPMYYAQNPLEIVKIWKGGMAFHGGLLGTILALWLFARRYGVSTVTVMDIVAAAVPIGLFFGRLANFVNAEVVGRVSNVPWAMVFPDAGPLPRHPSQLYEAALEGVALFLLLRWLTHRRWSLQSPGLTAGAFLAGYAVFRIICELFRHDDYRALLGSLPLTSGMAYSIPMIVVGALMMRHARSRAAA